MLLPPILKDLHEAEPRIVIEVIASNDASDLLRREADIAIRNFRPKEPDLVARKIRDATGRFFGTPAYLDRLGPIATAPDLSRASIIGLDDTALMIEGLRAMGLDLTEANFPLRSASFLVMWALVKQDLGLGLIDDRIGDADPDVRRVLADLAPFPFPVWLTAHREIHRNRRLRFVFDFLAQALK
jgi:DNA-binding transcriptional LysR family regulator